MNAICIIHSMLCMHLCVGQFYYATYTWVRPTLGCDLHLGATYTPANTVCVNVVLHCPNNSIEKSNMNLIYSGKCRGFLSGVNEGSPKTHIHTCRMCK